MRIENLLHHWHQSPDLLFSVHPVKRSLISVQWTEVAKSVNRKSANSWAHSAIANPQNILGVPVRKSQTRKFLWSICKSQICKFLQNIAAQLCLKTVLKFVFLNDHKIELEHTGYMLYLWGEIVCICGHAEVLSPQIRVTFVKQCSQKGSCTYFVKY